MIEILKEWEGKFEINGEEKENLENVQLQDGEQFHIRLIPVKESKND